MASRLPLVGANKNAFGLVFMTAWKLEGHSFML